MLSRRFSGKEFSFVYLFGFFKEQSGGEWLM